MNPVRKISPVTIQQSDITVLAMELAYQQPGHWMAIGDIKDFILTKYDHLPDGGEKSPLDQVVGNLVSNRRTKNSMFSRGYANYVRGGIEITESGEQFLRTLPR